MRVMAHFTSWQYANAKRRVLDGFNFMMDENHNQTSKEQALELIAQFKSQFYFDKLEVENTQPDLYNQSHFYALFRNHEQTCNYEFILRVRKYAHREGYECHLSIQHVETTDATIHLDLHNFDLPVNV